MVLTPGSNAHLSIHARSPEKSRSWTGALNIPVFHRVEDWPPNPGWVFLAVPDSALSGMPDLLADAALGPDTLVWHAAGAVPLEAIQARAGQRAYRHAVAWPMMSFAGGENNTLDWTEVPWCLEGAADALDHMEALLKPLGGRMQRSDARQRKQLHLAAVWANNFPAYCFGVAAALLREQGIPQDMMLPIIRQSALRLTGQGDPFDWLTGPALRGDAPTMQAHLELMQDHPEWAALYRSLSAAIAGRAKGAADVADPAPTAPED